MLGAGHLKTRKNDTSGILRSNCHTPNVGVSSGWRGTSYGQEVQAALNWNALKSNGSLLDSEVEVCPHHCDKKVNTGERKRRRLTNATSYLSEKSFPIWATYKTEHAPENPTQHNHGKGRWPIKGHAAHGLKFWAHIFSALSSLLTF